MSEVEQHREVLERPTKINIRYCLDLSKNTCTDSETWLIFAPFHVWISTQFTVFEF